MVPQSCFQENKLKKWFLEIRLREVLVSFCHNSASHKSYFISFWYMFAWKDNTFALNTWISAASEKAAWEAHNIVRRWDAMKNRELQVNCLGVPCSSLHHKVFWTCFYEDSKTSRDNNTMHVMQPCFLGTPLSCVTVIRTGLESDDSSLLIKLF